MGGNTLSVELDTLELKVQSNADQAALKVDKLTSALNNLKGITKGGVGLTTVANQLSKLNGALSGLNINSKKITELKSALSGLSDVQKSTGLTSTINALKKLPQISKELSATDLSKFAGQMTQVANAVRPLASEMEKVSAGFKAFPIRIQKLISSNTGLAASNKTTGKSFGFFGTGISSAITKIGVWYLALRKIASVMAEWINESNSYIENMNLFTVAMGEAAQGAYDYAVQVNKVLGIDTSEWIRNQGVFKQITSGFGIAENDANQMSKVLTQLGYDISSFFNISIEDAMQKVQSGISGELEPLRRLGYALDQATLQQVAYNHGIDQSINTMTQAEKSYLRFIAIYDQSKNVMGDLARTVQTPANAIRILNQQITQLKRALGNLLLPILQQIIPWIQAFVVILTDAIQALANFFGFELPTIDYSGMDNIAVSAGGAADAVEDTANALGEAAGEAKKLKDYTLGFDELNIIKPDINTGNDHDGGSTAGIGGIDSGLDLSDYDYDFLGDAKSNVDSIIGGIRAWAGEMKEKLAPQLKYADDVFKRIGDFFRNSQWGSFGGFLQSTFSYIGEFAAKFGLLNLGDFSTMFLGLVEFFSGLSKWNTEDMVNGIKDFTLGVMSLPFDTLFLFIDGIGQLFGQDWGILDWFQGVKQSILDLNLGQWAADAKEKTIAVWEEIVTYFQEHFQAIGDFFKGLWESISGFFTQLWTDIQNVWSTVSNWFNTNIIQPIVSGFEGLKTRISQLFEGLWLIIQAVWVTVSDWFNTNVIEPIVGFFSGLWEKVSGFFTQLWEDIQGVWNPVSEWFNSNVVQPVTNFFKGVWTNVSGFFTNLWTDIQGVWNNASQWFDKNVIQPVTGSFDTVTSSISGAFSSAWLAVRQGAANAMNGVISGIESAINWIVDGINGLLGGFNNVASWAGNVLGKNWGGVTLLNRVYLGRVPVPQYEFGGFPTPGQLFVANEPGNPEMIGSIGGRTAVANNEQITEAIAAAVYNAVVSAQAQQADRPIQINETINLDGRAVYRNQRQVEQAQGYRMTTSTIPV